MILIVLIRKLIVSELDAFRGLFGLTKFNMTKNGFYGIQSLIKY